LADHYIHLLLAQALAFCSRSTFWTSIQSLGSQLPGANLGKKLGKLYAWNHGGGLIGLSLGGVILALLGFHNAFIALTSIAILCVVLSLGFPHVEPKPSGRALWEITQGIGRFLGYRHIWLAISVSFAAALPSALSQSIYPVYLAFLEYREQWIGILISLRTLGPLMIGLMLGSFITISRQRNLCSGNGGARPLPGGGRVGREAFVSWLRYRSPRSSRRHHGPLVSSTGSGVQQSGRSLCRDGQHRARLDSMPSDHAHDRWLAGAGPRV